MFLPERYSKAGHLPEWQALVDAVRVTHSRKAGFLSAFEQIVTGTSEAVSPSPYTSEAQARWKRLTS